MSAWGVVGAVVAALLYAFGLWILALRIKRLEDVRRLDRDGAERLDERVRELERAVLSGRSRR